MFCTSDRSGKPVASPEKIITTTIDHILFTLPYGQVMYSCIKKCFFGSFFRNISKTAEIILIKKNLEKPWHFGLQKSSNK